MERVDGEGKRRPVDPGMIAQFDQLEAHHHMLTGRIMALRSEIQQAVLANNTPLIGSLTRELDELCRKELLDGSVSQVNYIMYLVSLLEQARIWTERNFDITEAVIRMLAATVRPDHPLQQLPQFHPHRLDEDVDAVLDTLYGDGRQGAVFTTDTGVELHSIHAKEACEGPFCVVHRPAPGPWADWDTHWREDLQLMVRICVHDVHHVAIEEQLRTPVIGMIAHQHPDLCQCPCDLSRVESILDEGGNILGFKPSKPSEEN